MGTPKISVIVPVYNTEKYLKTCIDSITSQTFKDIEIIIVDDGSQEECARFCDEIASSDHRIKVIHKLNAGAGEARNTGLAAAEGEYIGFVDSDDYIAPEMYEKLYDATQRYNADITLSGVCFVGGNTFEESGEDFAKNMFDEDTVFENDAMKELLLGIVGALPHEADDSKYGVGIWKNIFRRSILIDNNITFLSERKIMSEDALFMVDYVKNAKKAVGIHGAYYRYRRNDTSISKSYNSQRFEKCIIFLSEIEKHIEDVVSREEYKIYLDRLIQAYARVLCSQEIMHAKDENIKYSHLRARLEAICTHEKIQNALKTYPWYKLPIKQAAFAFAMKYKLYFLQRLMVIFRAG